MRVEFQNSQMTIQAENVFEKDWLEREFKIIYTTTGYKDRVEVTVNREWSHGESAVHFRWAVHDIG